MINQNQRNLTDREIEIEKDILFMIQMSLSHEHQDYFKKIQHELGNTLGYKKALTPYLKETKYKEKQQQYPFPYDQRYPNLNILTVDSFCENNYWDYSKTLQYSISSLDSKILPKKFQINIGTIYLDSNLDSKFKICEDISKNAYHALFTEYKNKY